MELNLAIAADAVEQREDGKYNIQGVFTEIVSPVLPIIVPQINVIVGFDANVAEVNTDREIEVRLQKTDGEVRISSSHTHRVPPVPRPGSRSFFVLVFPFINVLFENAGPHEFVIRVDNDVKQRNVPIYVNEPLEVGETE